MSYKHYRFSETCADEPAAILALVEKMFAEIQALPYGKHCWVRTRPFITRSKLFEGGTKAHVHFRFSLELESPPDETELFGFGLAPIKAEGQPMCPVCDSTSCTCGYVTK